MRQWTFILSVAAAVAGGATSASATPLPSTTFDFTSCHIAAGCGALPYGSVTLTQNGSNVDVNVSGPNFVAFAQTGALKGGDALFAFNGANMNAADIINEVATASKPPVLNGIDGSFGANGLPDFGSFAFAIACATCSGASNGITAISFTVQNALIADLTAPNNTGTIFIADVLMPGGATGVVGVSAVPGPIVGAGLPGLVMACGGLLGPNSPQLTRASVLALPPARLLLSNR